MLRFGIFVGSKIANLEKKNHGLLYRLKYGDFEHFELNTVL